jgi:hypothetical protein
MDRPFPDKTLAVDASLLNDLKNKEGHEVLSLLVSQRVGDLLAVKLWALAHIDKDIAFYEERYEKEEDNVKKSAMELGLRVLRQLKINIQNESTVYSPGMF